MNGDGHRSSLGRQLGAIRQRLIGLADEPTDDDDVRLRKRVGVVAGYINALAALQLPVLAQGLPLSWAVAVTMPLVSVVNLVVLARTRRFDRYVVALILSVMLFAAFVEVALGGLAGASAAYVFAFLGPVYAILALGARRATAWFIFFLVILVGLILIDPLVSSRIEPQPYPMRLIFYAANLGVPLGITFVMLRYTDLRRHEAQARADDLLFNAIPTPIAARLKRGERRIAESYPNTTVLFADLAGFTPWARQTDPARVVGFHKCWSPVRPPGGYEQCGHLPDPLIRQSAKLPGRIPTTHARSTATQLTRATQVCAASEWQRFSRNPQLRSQNRLRPVEGITLAGAATWRADRRRPPCHRTVS